MIQHRNPADLIPYDRNPRRNDGAVDAVAASIADFGFQSPIIVDAESVVIVGHTRLKAALKLGLAVVPVLTADLSPEKVTALRLVDNKVGELAEWDYALLERELDALDLDMTVFGFEHQQSDEEDPCWDEEAPDTSVTVVAFTVAPEQREQILDALDRADLIGIETFGNGNKRGNALYKAVTEWAAR